MPPSPASAAPSGAGLERRPFDPAIDAGPRAALLLQRAYAVVLLLAFISLGRQVLTLIGSRGLLPAAELLARARTHERSLFDLPSLFWLGASDQALLGGTLLGGGLAIAALLGWFPRTCLVLSAPLYLSYVTVAQDFLAFQWDNLLVESALVVAALDPRAPSRLAWLCVRVLLFKLYFESGIAKWQSHLHDWHDGSAMTFYFETAPLPAALGYYAHQLPTELLRLSSWGALLLELPLPLLIFAPRRPRLLAFAALTGFQLVNTATANYGFFTYVTLVLHVALLCDDDVRRAGARLGRLARRLPGAVALGRRIAGLARARPAATTVGAPRRTATRVAGGAAAVAWLAASLGSGLVAFASPRPDGLLRRAHALYAPLRVANAYHLFGHITRERLEVQLETEVDGRFQEHDLRYKPGDPMRRPPYVAPHQPRVDFRLWFYALSLRRGMPGYVHALLERACSAPDAVQSLFEAPLPQRPDAVRLAVYRYRFSTLAERSATGAYWRRERLGQLPARSCR